MESIDQTIETTEASERNRLLQTHEWLLTDRRFKKLESSYQRIEFILNWVQPFELFCRDVQQKVTEYKTQHMKCRIKSKNCRLLAMKSFRENDYQSAKDWFIKAILSAPFPTEADTYGNALSLSFAGKSVVEFQMKNFLSALFDANYSLELYETIEMLLQRIQCLRKLRRFQETLELLDQLISRSDLYLRPRGKSVYELRQLKDSIIGEIAKSQEPAVELPQSLTETEEPFDGQFWVHPSCCLSSDPKKGRHLVAKQFVPKETILLIEQPFSSVLKERSNHCGNCFQLLVHHFYPCFGCDELVFCSKSCSKECYEKCHKYDCTFLGFISRFGVSFVHTFRIISRIGFRRAIEWEENKTDTDFTRYLQSDEVMDYKVMYRAFTSLVDHISHCDRRSGIYHSFKAIETAILLINGNESDVYLKSFVVLSDICFRSSLKVTTNSYRQSPTPTLKRKYSQTGDCVSIVASLFNHSCDPNVLWSLTSRKFVAKSHRDIEVGDEMTVSYGPNVRFHSIHKRQTELRTDYHFTCRCEACLCECRSLLTLRCDHCSGPVLYNLCLPRSLVDRRIYCLECGEKCRELRRKRRKVRKNKENFEKMVGYLDYNEEEVEYYLSRAEHHLKELLNVGYCRSGPLLSYVIQLMANLMRFDRLEEALKYGHLIHRAIEMDLNQSADKPLKPSTLVFEYLFLVTECYYHYLDPKEVLDTNHWQRCFTLYSQLLDLLDKQKNFKNENNDSEEESEECRKRNQLFDNAIKTKRIELLELKQEFKELGHSPSGR